MPRTALAQARLPLVQARNALVQARATLIQPRLPVDPWYRAGGAPAPVAAYQFKGANSQAASRSNLAQPGAFDLTSPAEPTWSQAAGAIFNGSTQYYNTNGIDIDTANWTVLAQFTAATGTQSRTLLGQSSFLAQNFSLVPSEDGANPVWHYGTEEGPGGLILGAAMTTGNMAMAGTSAYRDGILVGTIPDPAFTGQLGFSLLLGASTVDAIPSLHKAVTLVAVVFYNTTTGASTWLPAVAAAMAAL